MTTAPGGVVKCAARWRCVSPSDIGLTETTALPGTQVVLREWRKVTKADAKEPHDTLTARAQSANLGRLVNPVAAPQTRAVIRTARRSMGLNREQPIGHNKVAPSLEPIVHAEADVSTRSRESIINVVSTKSEELVSAPEASSLLERLCCGLVTGHTVRPSCLRITPFAHVLLA